jgi:hypothetical protein
VDYRFSDGFWVFGFSEENCPCEENCAAARLERGPAPGICSAGVAVRL